MAALRFEWDRTKDHDNQRKHGRRYDCFGQVEGGVLTVRFTYRDDVIRIIGAGYWRRGEAIYERENQIHE